MNVLLVISCIIIIAFAVYGYTKGFVKALVPILSGVLALILIFLLKDWLLAFLLRWAIFQGEHIFSRIVVILLIYIATTLAFKWLFGVLKILTRLPLVHGMNKLLGLLLGVVEGFLCVWLILYMIQMREGILFGIDFRNMITHNSFLSFLSEHNLITHLMTTLFGGWVI